MANDITTRGIVWFLTYLRTYLLAYLLAYLLTYFLAWSIMFDCHFILEVSPPVLQVGLPDHVHDFVGLGGVPLTVDG